MSEANRKPIIASFWYGSDLSWLEAVCIKSYLDNGHRFVLYCAEGLLGVPKGAEVRPASEIFWPPPFDISDNDRLRVAVFSDIFRLLLIQQTGFVWVDLDAYCVRQFDFNTSFIFAQSKRATYPNGVLGLPTDSDALENMLKFLMMKNPTQPWRGRKLKEKNKLRAERGEVWGIETLAWGCSGPKALEFFLKQSGEASHALPSYTFYPLSPEELFKLHSPGFDIGLIELNGVYSVHIYGHQKKIIANSFNGLPVPKSYLDLLCRRHCIDPREAPVKSLSWM